MAHLRAVHAVKDKTGFASSEELESSSGLVHYAMGLYALKNLHPASILVSDKIQEEVNDGIV